MEIKFNGELEVRADAAKAADFLKDFDKVAACIPDSSNFARLDSKSFSLVVTVGVAFIKGSFPLKCSIVESGADRIAYSVSGTGAGSSVDITIKFSISPRAENGTVIVWEAVGKLGGLISGIGENIVRKESEKSIGKIISNVKEGIEKL